MIISLKLTTAEWIWIREMLKNCLCSPTSCFTIKEYEATRKLIDATENAKEINMYIHRDK